MGILASQAARELGISSRTLAIWADKGRIRAERSTGNWRLYNAGDVTRLKAKLDRQRQRSNACARA